MVDMIENLMYNVYRYGTYPCHK